MYKYAMNFFSPMLFVNSVITSEDLFGCSIVLPFFSGYMNKECIKTVINKALKELYRFKEKK